MSALYVYGASDDLVEVEGLVREEFGCYDAGRLVLSIKVDDALYAQLRIEYDPDDTGEWRIRSTWPGSSVVAIARATGDDGKRDEHGCPDYSDKATVLMGDIEARRVSLQLDKAAS